MSLRVLWAPAATEAARLYLLEGMLGRMPAVGRLSLGEGGREDTQLGLPLWLRVAVCTQPSLATERRRGSPASNSWGVDGGGPFRGPGLIGAGNS